ncbi:protein kinase domain-containing protein [Catenuloplanes atrovinosus]|uniref:non-specific serine/threonine protein kinase n=1 Tax=Catenuloplanes atrovinosus TaxID=137266 RepID=A0AAE3YQ97_9ACTN|nr:protein kinase [Catenuloplanes atrovinosus]MDR7277849.1 serine/threonine-protein kinase [Catenuloplanes atrovinosus]
MPEPAAGTRLNGRYVLDGRIGLGGMSEVWRAADETLGRAVAVKILSGTAAEDPLLRAAIRREARAAARMTHPHAMHVYDYGEFSTGTAVLPYIVMELVEGSTLADRLLTGPPMPWRAAARMAAEISAALADAHRLGVVHRDIKPANVMLTPSGAAKVLDFGIATLVTADPQHATGSFAGHRPGGTEILDGWLAGTPPYAAPELLLRGEAGPPADVYAVGATLYQALTGEPPLAITTWEEAAAVHRSGAATPAPLPPGVPESLAAACLACLSRDPAARPAASVIARIFGRYAAGADDPAPVSPAPVPPGTVPAGPVSPGPGIGAGQSPGRPGTAGRFAPGAAAVPAAAAHTSLDVPAPARRPAVPAGRSWSGRLRGPGGIGVLAAVLIAGGVALVTLAAPLFGADTRRGPDAAGIGDPAAPAAAPATSATTPDRSPSPSPSPSPDDEVVAAGTILNRLDAALAQGLVSRDINARAGSRLFDDLADLRRDLDDPEALSEGAADLQERLERLADDGDVTPDVASDMIEIVDDLVV